MATPTQTQTLENTEKLKYNPKYAAPSTTLETKPCVTCNKVMSLPTNYKNCVECDLHNRAIEAKKHKEAQRKYKEKIKSGGSVSENLTCERCHNVPIKRPDHYCQECREAAAVEKMALESEKKKESYHIKKSLKVQSVLDNINLVITAFTNKDTDAIASFSREQVDKAIHLYFNNLSDNEMKDAALYLFNESDTESGSM